MKMSLAQAASICRGALSGADAQFEGLQVDSRAVTGGELFCAVRGERVDGHDFLEAAGSAGAVGALVEKAASEAPVSTVLCHSVGSAMATIALHFRRALKGPAVGVTGSAGKTTVKEMIAAALSPLGAVLKTEGNLNTEYGVPMTWSRLDDRHKSAVIEMAMRGPGQIAHLARMSAPDIGVITSIGSAHIGELGSKRAIAQAKSELLQCLPPNGTAIIPSATEFQEQLRAAASARVVTVGVGGDYQVLEWRQSGDFVEFAVRCPSGDVAGSVPGIGEIQSYNAALALAAAEAAGVPPEQAANALKRARFPEKRMQVLHRGGVTIWLDAYNSSPESCRLALRSFAEFRIAGKKIAVLGDMLELGDFTEDEHRGIGKLVASTDIQELVLVGNHAPWIGEAARQAGFEGEILQYEDARAAREAVNRAKKGDAILIKASRGVALEEALEEPQ